MTRETYAHLELVAKIMQDAGFAAGLENGFVCVELKNRPVTTIEVETVLEEYELVSEGMVKVEARSQYGDVLVEVIEG